ncbi:acetamidase [Paracoccidioides lutzii Pb01]|uniref:amidase n=1 Tax=Paracoccidioides lutzii (strain ATCC MYA-826 / Pb01) TaxID=502779 RepID=C1H3L2_PARBA|nr:acetamidase [Paracoccidioides lutzii Pb01]EEH34306.2 acetamidase [Paracoccidioides lutzii Pb01]
MSAELSYKAIARKKLEQLNSRIPQEWQLSSQWIPAGMLSPEESVMVTNKYEAVNVMDVPRNCGLLKPKELQITERLDVKGLLHEIASGKLSAREVSEAFCKRAAISHQLTRCITEPLFEQALARASELDAHLKRTGKLIGPLHGLPISVKDSYDIKGFDSTIGLVSLAFKPATENAPLVDLLFDLGAIIVAKTNIPQTLGALDSVNNLFGRTLNPLNLKLTPGGSSGGEAVLVAMRGSMIGIGTDIGGSIRIPAMCLGIYGFKPSVGRFPFGSPSSRASASKMRVGLQAVGGPIARSMGDIDVLMKEVVPRAELYGEDCIPGQWGASETPPLLLAKPRKFTIGILPSDGRIQPLPPIAKVLNEVAQTLRNIPGVEVVEIPIPDALGDCQRVANDLMGLDGAGSMADLIEATAEPLIPWLQTRFKRGTPKTLAQACAIQGRRAELEREMLKMWTLPLPSLRSSSPDIEPRARKVDAIIHPIAPHPVPEHDRYNAVGYTSSWVLLDYAAGAVPVRKFTEADLELGREMEGKILSSWDKRNRELWNSSTVDRRVYLDSPLSIQVITPKLHENDLFKAMSIIDSAVRGQSTRGSGKGSKL